MDSILEDLYDLEMQAQHHEASISDRKLQVKKDFESKKQSLKTEVQQTYDKDLAAFKSDAEASKTTIMNDLATNFKSEMAKINQAVNNDQPKYVANFMAKLKNLGVEANE